MKFFEKYGMSFVCLLMATGNFIGALIKPDYISFWIFAVIFFVGAIKQAVDADIEEIDTKYKKKIETLKKEIEELKNGENNS